jgi:hypothetical protein
VLAAPGFVFPGADLDSDGDIDDFDDFDEDDTTSFFRRDTNNFSPRIGFACDITGGGASCCGGLRRSTTLRGSFGFTYERLFYATSPFFQNRFDFGVPSLVAGVPDPTGAIVPPIPLTPAGAPFGPLVPGTPLPGFLARGIDRDLDAPRISFWTLALDREIARNTVASLQYAGAHGKDLFTLANINRPGSAAAFLGVGGPTARLNPALGPVFFLRGNGRSNYNALIAEVTNSTWRTIGLQFTARYRWAKALDNVSPFFGNNFGIFGGALAPNSLSPFDPDNDYGPSPWDVRHRFIGSFIWELPFGVDSGCCGGSDGWRRWLLGGWEVAGIFQAMSGFPFDVFDCGGALTPETPCPRALVAPGVDLGDIRSGSGSSFPDPTIPNRFNFLGPGNFALTTTPTTVFPPFPPNTIGRNFFRGPNFWDFDFGLYKRFRFSEDTSFQIRGEFYNIFNHSNLFVPGAVDLSSTNFIPGFKRGRRIIQIGGKFIF